MAAGNANQRQWRPKIGSREDLLKLLKVMQPKFLEVVHPRQCGLLDHMYQAELLTETDLESLSGKDVNIRKDQARKVWIHLNKIPPKDFKAHVFPKLLEDFPHIIPSDFLTQEAETALGDTDQWQECLRHDIMRRIRPSSIADMLYQCDCLSLEEYESLVSDPNIEWTNLLGLFSDRSKRVTTQLVKPLQDLLQKHNISISCDLSEAMSEGFPCKCNDSTVSLLASIQTPLEKVERWAENSNFSQPPGSTWNSVSICEVTRCCNDSQFLGNENTVLDSSPASHQWCHVDGLLPFETQNLPKRKLKPNMSNTI